MTVGRAETFRWGACFVLALCFHGAGAAALLAKWNEGSEFAANSPVAMIDLAPAAVAPETTPNDVPPDRLASRAEEPEPEKPVEKIEVQPPPEAPKPEVALPPPPKKTEKPKEKPKAKAVDSAPPSAPQRANRAAAPLPGVFSHNANAESEWNARLVAHIARHKNFSGAERGVVRVAFIVDRSGGVHNAHVLANSGSSILDRDALALLQRSQPLPPPPPEVPGSQISKVLPVRYNDAR